LGFEITRTINGYYSDGEDAYVMTKRITWSYFRSKAKNEIQLRQFLG
jgi:hypothetical protein